MPNGPPHQPGLRLGPLQPCSRPPTQRADSQRPLTSAGRPSASAPRIPMRSRACAICCCTRVGGPSCAVDWQKDLAANPPGARRLVRLRRAVPVPRGGRGVPPRPPRPAGALRGGHRPAGRRANRTGLPAAAGVGRRIASGRRARPSAPWPPGARATSLPTPTSCSPRVWRSIARAGIDDAIATMKGEAAHVMGPCPRLVTAMALYRKGQKDEALKTLAAAVLSYDWSAAKADGPRRLDRSHPPPRGRGD